LAGARSPRSLRKARKVRKAMKRLLLGVEPEPEPEGFGEPGSRIPRLGRLGWGGLPRVGVEGVRANPA